MKPLPSLLQLALTLLLIAFVSGCANAPKVATKEYKPGTILLLPPRDVVQGGVPHARGVGSGLILQKDLHAALADSQFVVITTDNSEFTATEVASKDRALAEGRRLNAAFVLQLVLGEFLDAAPMTFRPDFVYLDKGMMYNVQSGDTVWEMTAPRMENKGNIGGYESLLSGHASAVAKSITGHVK